MITYCFSAAPIRMLSHMGHVHAVTDSPFDLLISAFIHEVGRLLSRGLLRQYVEMEDDLRTKKGRIAFGSLARRPRTSILLPCRYEDRTPDIFLNRLLRSVVHLAETQVTSETLGRRVSIMGEQMAQLCGVTDLTPDAFNTALGSLDRLSSGYRQALELAMLVYDSICPDRDAALTRRFTGFLLDMNRVFELFVGRLLSEFRPKDTTIANQDPFTGLYATDDGRFKHPRPDFVLRDAQGNRTHVLDAKYKFLDEREVDASDLYQLTAYALAIESKRAIAIYPGSPGSRSIREQAGGKEEGADLWPSSPSTYPSRKQTQGETHLYLGSPGAVASDGQTKDDVGLYPSSRDARSYRFRGHNCGATVVFRRLDFEDVWKVLDAPDKRSKGQELIAHLLG